MIAAFILLWAVVQTDIPIVSCIILRLDPVVDLISLDTRLAMTATSLLVLSLKFLKKLGYRDKMSVLAVVVLHSKTCCSKQLLVSLGQFHDSFTAVFHELYT